MQKKDIKVGEEYAVSSSRDAHAYGGAQRVRVTGPVEKREGRLSWDPPTYYAVPVEYLDRETGEPILVRQGLGNVEEPRTGYRTPREFKSTWSAYAAEAAELAEIAKAKRLAADEARSQVWSDNFRADNLLVQTFDVERTAVWVGRLDFEFAKQAGFVVVYETQSILTALSGFNRWGAGSITAEALVVAGWTRP